MISIRGKTESIQVSNEAYLMDMMCLYGTQLKRYAFMMLKDEHLAEDAVQKTFINFYYNLHKYRGESSEKNYLYTILTNECRQIKRRNWFKRESRLHYKELEQGQASGLDHNMDKIIIRQCLEKIKPKYREIIILYYYQKFSVADISSILNLTISAVKSRLQYARENLKPYLQEVFEDE